MSAPTVVMVPVADLMPGSVLIGADDDLTVTSVRHGKRRGVRVVRVTCEHLTTPIDFPRDWTVGIPADGLF